jgi:PelA/Pel-15E family pectate lyase
MKTIIRSIIFSGFYLIISAEAQQIPSNSLPYISLEKFSDGIHHWDLFSTIKDYKRLDTSDVIGIADNLVAYQNEDGGWPKNIDWLAILNADSVKGSLSDRYRESTFDNRNIFPQVEYLSKVYFYSGVEKFRQSALQGFKYILAAQNESGGWIGSDVDAITFNDDVMTGTMGILLDIMYNKEWFDWIEPELRNQLKTSFNEALSVTLKCQIKVNGVKSAWCQQHDHKTLEPVQARSYELPSITARESTDVVLFLMRIKNPGDSIIDAIESAVQWFERSKIQGYTYTRVEIPEVKYHETTVDYDQVLIPDSTAKPVWARYYDLVDGKPFLCRRDGTVVYKLEEIGFERRIGYAWYGYWPEAALRQYPEWKESIITQQN